MRGTRIGNEKLRSVGVGSIVGVREDATAVVLQLLAQFVLELAAPATLATLAGPSGIARLHHKAFDVSMEKAAVVVVVGTQSQEILQMQKHILENNNAGRISQNTNLASFRHFGAKQFNLDVAQIGVQCYRHDCGGRKRATKKTR